MSNIFSISEIAEINKTSINAKDNFGFINYLDTSSLTRNKISEIQFLCDDFPSRAKRKVKNNTILYSTVRPNQEHFGIVEKNEIDNLIVSTGFATIDVISKDILPKFLFYKLTQPFITNYLQGIAENSVSAYPSIKPDSIASLRFIFPDLSTQQKIASVLSALDDKIELNNRINAELEAMAKTLYDYWFVQFDFPIVTSSGVEKPYKSSGGKMVYNETLKREIPEGWEVKKLEEIVKKISNSINPNDFQDLKYLPIDKLPKKSFSYSDFEDRENANSSLIKFDKDDILLGAMRVYFHRVCLAYEDGISRNTLFVLRPKHKFLRLFSLFLINKEETIQFANDNSTGSSIPYAKWENGLADYQFCLPSENLIVKFEKQISPIMDKIINNSKQNQELSALRDWLLPMLMNGQVKVG